MSQETSRKFYIKYLSAHLSTEAKDLRIGIRNLIEEKCEAAKKLTPRKKIMFLLYFDHGHSLKDIGELCGISEGAVKGRLEKITDEIDENETKNEGDSE